MAKIPRVNEENEVIGETTIREAKDNNWPRRVVRVFVFDENGDVLLQKRSSQVKTYSGLWDSCGGHVDVGETCTEAGAREIHEELGINAKVKEVDGVIRFKDLFISPCRAVVPHVSHFVLKEDEVAEVKWVQLEVFECDIKERPETYTPWTVHTWQVSRDKLIA